MPGHESDKGPENEPEVARLDHLREDRLADEERLRIHDDPDDDLVRWLTAEFLVEHGLPLDTVEVPEGFMRPYTDEERRLSELSRDETVPEEWRSQARTQLHRLRDVPIEDRPPLPPRVKTSGDPLQDWYEANHPEEAAQELADRVVPFLGPNPEGDFNA